MKKNLTELRSCTNDSTAGALRNSIQDLTKDGTTYHEYLDALDTLRDLAIGSKEFGNLDHNKRVDMLYLFGRIRKVLTAARCKSCEKPKLRETG